MVKTEKKFLNMYNARTDEQRQVMNASEDAGVCPFCQPHLHNYHKDPILMTGKHWLVTTNAWPYPHVKHHFLFITTTHIENLAELPVEAGAELLALAQQLIEHYQIPGGGLAMRFGDGKYSAGSVKHLHAQLIQPDIEAADYEPVRFKIGADRK